MADTLKQIRTENIFKQEMRQKKIVRTHISAHFLLLNGNWGPFLAVLRRIPAYHTTVSNYGR